MKARQHTVRELFIFDRCCFLKAIFQKNDFSPRGKKNTFKLFLLMNCEYTHMITERKIIKLMIKKKRFKFIEMLLIIKFSVRIKC